MLARVKVRAVHQPALKLVGARCRIAAEVLNTRNCETTGGIRSCAPRGVVPRRTLLVMQNILHAAHSRHMHGMCACTYHNPAYLSRCVQARRHRRAARLSRGTLASTRSPLCHGHERCTEKGWMSPDLEKMRCSWGCAHSAMHKPSLTYWVQEAAAGGGAGHQCSQVRVGRGTRRTKRLRAAGREACE